MILDIQPFLFSVLWHSPWRAQGGAGHYTPTVVFPPQDVQGEKRPTSMIHPYQL